MINFLFEKNNSFDDLLNNYVPGDVLYPLVYIESNEYQNEFLTSFYLCSSLAIENGVRFENDRLIIQNTPEDYYTNRQLLLDKVGIDSCTYYVQGSPQDKCIFFSKWALNAFEQEYYHGRKAAKKERDNLVGVVSLYHEGYREALTIMLLRSPIICQSSMYFKYLMWTPKYDSLKYIGKRYLKMCILDRLCNEYLSNSWLNTPLYSPSIDTKDEEKALAELDSKYESLPEDIKNRFIYLPNPVKRSIQKNTETSLSIRMSLVGRYMHSLFNFLKSQTSVGNTSQFLRKEPFSDTVDFVERSYNRIMSTPEFSLTRKSSELMFLCVDLYLLNRLYESNLKARRVISRWLYILLYRARNEVSLEEKIFIDAMMVNTITFNAEQFDSMLKSVTDTKIKTSYFTDCWGYNKPRFATSEIAFYFNGGEEPIINQLSEAEKELLSDKGVFGHDTTFEQMLDYMKHSVSHTVMDIEFLRESYAELLYKKLVQDSSIQPYFGFVEYEQTW